MAGDYTSNFRADEGWAYQYLATRHFVEAMAFDMARSGVRQLQEDPLTLREGTLRALTEAIAADLELKLGNPVRAVELADSALAPPVAPTPSMVISCCLTAAKALEQLNRPREALERCDRAVSAAKGEPAMRKSSTLNNVHITRVRVLSSLQRYDEARTLLTELFNTTPVAMTLATGAD